MDFDDMTPDEDVLNENQSKDQSEDSTVIPGTGVKVVAKVKRYHNSVCFHMTHHSKVET
jgi:hypothetical protein